MNEQLVKVVEDFDVVENKAGKLMFVLHEQEGKPFPNPTMKIGEDNSAVLYRNAEVAISLKEVPKDAAKALETLEEVKITEMAENGDFAHVYDVTVVK